MSGDCFMFDSVSPPCSAHFRYPDLRFVQTIYTPWKLCPCPSPTAMYCTHSEHDPRSHNCCEHRTGRDTMAEGEKSRQGAM